LALEQAVTGPRLTDGGRRALVPAGWDGRANSRRPGRPPTVLLLDSVLRASYANGLSLRAQVVVSVGSAHGTVPTYDPWKLTTLTLVLRGGFGVAGDWYLCS